MKCVEVCAQIETHIMGFIKSCMSLQIIEMMDLFVPGPVCSKRFIITYTFMCMVLHVDVFVFAVPEFVYV